MASISSTGGALLVNQMTPAVASNQNAHTNRVDFQNMIAQSQAQEKDEKVLEVRPTEENQEVNEDKEHTRDEADRESKRNKKVEEQEEEEDGLPHYTLDVRV
jgi:electron transfer flavoprotein alpha subunit